MTGVFFIVGPTATGKSQIAAEVAAAVGAEIINADAFQIYRGLDLLTAKPSADLLKKAPHHLLSIVPLSEEMNVEKFRSLALAAIEEIQKRGRKVIVTGGSGLYVKALTHGLSELPSSDPKLRGELEKLTLENLRGQLIQLDPEAGARVDLNNRRRVVRALEICLLSGQPATSQRQSWKSATDRSTGVFVFRDRAELYERIDRRVKQMFEQGVLEEARGTGETSKTAAKTLGLSQLRDILAGTKSAALGCAEIQQLSRRYAKRQLTWFRGQSNFEPLNLSQLSHEKAVEGISERARRSFGLEG